MKMKELHNTENLLGSYTSEDEKLQLCIKQICPLLDLIKYYKNMKNKVNEMGSTYVRQIDFSKLSEYYEKIPDMLELISTAFPYIRKQKFNQIIKEIDLFKMNFEIVKYNETVYKIVSHDNFNMIKNSCLSNLESLSNSYIFSIYNHSSHHKHNIYLYPNHQILKSSIYIHLLYPLLNYE